MRTSVALLALSFMISAGCGGSQTPAPETSPKQAAQADNAAGSAKAAASEVDLGKEVLGTLTVASLDALLDRGTTLIRPQLPPAFQAMAQAEALKAQLFAAFNAPELAQVLDTGRPLALAMVDPRSVPEKGLGPVMAAIPVKDPNGLVDILAKKASGHETTPRKDHVFTLQGETISLRFADGYALAASQQRLLDGSAKVLLPLLKDPVEDLARVNVDMEAVYAKYGDEIEKGMNEAKVTLEHQPIGKVNTGNRMLQRWMGYIKGIKAVQTVLSIRGNDLRWDILASAKGSGGFADYLGNLNAGKPWGLEYLPDGSALVAVARSKPESMMQDINDAIDSLMELISQWVPKESIESWREAIKKSVAHYSGEGAGAFWATSDGGMGMAGASKMTDGKAGKEALRQWMSFFGAEIERLQGKVFKKELAMLLPGFKLSLNLKKDALKVAGEKGDLYQIKVAWPRLKDKDQAKMLDKVKKGVAKVLGKDLSMAYVVVGDVVLSTMGKDFDKRIKLMVEGAKQGKSSALPQKFSPYMDGRDVVMAIYTPLEALAEQALRIASQVTQLPAEVREMATAVMPGPNTEVPLCFVSHRKGNTLVWETSVSANLVGMIARGVMFKMSQQAAKGAP